MNETRHVMPERAEQIGSVLAAAFADDPVMHWMFPKVETRQGFVTAFMTMACRRSIEVGHAYELAEGSGAALWGPPGVHFYNEAAGIELYGILSTANGDRTDFVLEGLSGLSEQHPEAPHFYLSNIGVDPASRGNGYGAVLLNRILATCDTEGIVAYLESSNPRNVSLYERAGFEVTAEIELPEGPVMRPMTRLPR